MSNNDRTRSWEVVTSVSTRKTNKRFNVAIIGAGNIASEFDYHAPEHRPAYTHAKAFTQHHGFKVCAIVDPWPQRANRAAKRWEIPNHGQAISELKTVHKTIEVASICSPPDSHLNDIQTSIKTFPNLKLIFCEKPLSGRYQSAEGLEQSLKIPIVVNYSRRWDHKLRELKNSDFLPTVRHISAYYTKGLFANGTHLVDLFYNLFGDFSLNQQCFINQAEDPLIKFDLLTACGKSVQIIPLGQSEYSMFEIDFYSTTEYRRMLNGGRFWMRRVSVDDPEYSGHRTLGSTTIENGGYGLTMRNAVTEIYRYLNSPEKQSLSSTLLTASLTQKFCQSLADGCSGQEVKK